MKTSLFLLFHRWGCWVSEMLNDIQGHTAGQGGNWDHRLGLTSPAERLGFPRSTLAPLWEGHQRPLMDPAGLSLGEVIPCSPKWHILPEASKPPTACWLSYSQDTPFYIQHAIAEQFHLISLLMLKDVFISVWGFMHSLDRILTCRWQLSAPKEACCSSTHWTQCRGVSFLWWQVWDATCPELESLLWPSLHGKKGFP